MELISTTLIIRSWYQSHASIRELSICIFRCYICSYLCCVLQALSVQQWRLLNLFGASDQQITSYTLSTCCFYHKMVISFAYLFNWVVNKCRVDNSSISYTFYHWCFIYEVFHFNCVFLLRFIKNCWYFLRIFCESDCYSCIKSVDWLLLFCFFFLWSSLLCCAHDVLDKLSNWIVLSLFNLFTLNTLLSPSLCMFVSILHSSISACLIDSSISLDS